MAGTDVDKVIKTLQDLELGDESDCYVYLVVEKSDPHSGEQNYIKLGGLEILVFASQRCNREIHENWNSYLIVRLK